ncbi:SWIM zinc finger family protein [Nocardiopsis halotolerans]|uniref:SWIM zinc finger family protein n=1 Tax=Nocardiopsis halotolerans TaxID=124252 RepID=UPI000371638D|nr:SWIM zinc finger family protein [Nocardiopsis halotolerans]
MAKETSWPERGVVAATSGGASAVWGECKGSGAKPYLAAVHLDGPKGTAYKCSCPSRKIPCKHVLALLALWAQDSVAVRDDRPEWVTKWLGGRAARQAREENGAPAAPADPEKAARTLRKREEAVGAGMDELGLWLRDQIESGLAEVPKHGYDHWDRMAKRLVDAKAGGASALVSRLPGAARGDRWPERLLERLSLLHLLATGYRAGDALGERTRGAVRAHVGITTRVEDVLAHGERVRDTWRVLGWRDTFSPEADMRTRRLWLRGAGTGRTALHLSFARDGQTPVTPFRSGTDVTAEFAFYPDGHRIAPGHDGDTGPGTPPEGGTVPEALDAFAAAVAEDPWRDTWPVVLDRAAPAHDDRWYLTDPDGFALPLAVAEPWQLLAVTGGHPATVAAEWSPKEGLTPITVWDRNGKAVSL